VSLQPLQVPGGPELLILVVVVLVVFGLVGRWVYRDAKSRGMDWAWQWGVGVGLLFLFGLVPGLLGVLIYVSVRDEVDDTADAGGVA
jgi:hypothetical protein